MEERIEIRGLIDGLYLYKCKDGNGLGTMYYELKDNLYRLRRDLIFDMYKDKLKIGQIAKNLGMYDGSIKTIIHQSNPRPLDAKIYGKLKNLYNRLCTDEYRFNDLQKDFLIELKDFLSDGIMKVFLSNDKTLKEVSDLTGCSSSFVGSIITKFYETKMKEKHAG